MATKSKKENRLISYVSIGIFAVSLVCVGIFGSMIFKEYQTKQRLLQEEQQLKEEFRDVYPNIDNDGYYNVYLKGDRVVYGYGDTIEVKE